MQKIVYDSPIKEKGSQIDCLFDRYCFDGLPNVDNSSPHSPAKSIPSGFAMAFPKESAILVGYVTTKNIPVEVECFGSICHYLMLKGNVATSPHCRTYPFMGLAVHNRTIRTLQAITANLG